MFFSLESPASVVLFVARGKLGKPCVYSTVRPKAAALKVEWSASVGPDPIIM